MGLLGWLVNMCTKNPLHTLAWGDQDPVTQEELLDDREIPWLPIDRGSRPLPELDGLIKTGHAERSPPVPMVLKLATSTLKCQEAIRLTRKGREAAARYDQLRPTDAAAALEVILEMFVFSEVDVEALRAWIKD